AAITLGFGGSAHQCLVVITPQPTSLTDAFSLVKLMHRRRPVLQCQIIVNMCADVAQAREIFHRFSTAVEKYVGIRAHYLGHLLRDESLRNAVTLQSPVALFPESDPSSRSFIRLADSLRHVVETTPPGLGFTLFWQRQFRQRQANARPEKSTWRSGGDESSYLAELKSRLLTLIAKADQPTQELTAAIEEVQRAYTKRYGNSPTDPQAAIDALLADPRRHESALRQLAERLAPWMPTSHELAPSAVTTTAAPSAIDTAAAPIVSAPASIPHAPVRSVVPAHRYNENRFGSQHALLDLFQKRCDSGKTALELIEILYV